MNTNKHECEQRLDGVSTLRSIATEDGSPLQPGDETMIVTRSMNLFPELQGASKYFLPYQRRWLDDESPLKIIEKSRQIGMTYVDAYDSVIKASSRKAADVYVSSRDLVTTRLYLEQCVFWARFLKIAAENIGEQIIQDD